MKSNNNSNSSKNNGVCVNVCGWSRSLRACPETSREPCAAQVIAEVSEDIGEAMTGHFGFGLQLWA